MANAGRSTAWLAARRKRSAHADEEARPLPRRGALADINITPLIDVMLVLLIIFMLVTSVAHHVLDIALPQSSRTRPPDPPPPPFVTMEVEEGTVTVDRRPVSMEDLPVRLRDLLQSRADKTVVVRAAGGVLYGRVVQAMDIARGAGALRIGVLSDRKGGEND